MLKTRSLQNSMISPGGSTDKGVERTEVTAHALEKLGVKPTLLYTSPRVRARQTAEILAKALGVAVSVREEVGFGFNVQHIGPLTADAGTNNDVMFVAHEPDLSIIISTLIGGGEIVMKKGGLARVDLFSRAPLRGALVWMIAPKLFSDLHSK